MPIQGSFVPQSAAVRSPGIVILVGAPVGLTVDKVVIGLHQKFGLQTGKEAVISHAADRQIQSVSLLHASFCWENLAFDKERLVPDISFMFICCTR